MFTLPRYISIVLWCLCITIHASEEKKTRAAEKKSTLSDAQLVLKQLEARNRHAHFGTAILLKPLFDNKPSADVMYWFGRSLFTAGMANQQYKDAGLQLMDKSGLLKPVFFDEVSNQKDFQDFQDFCLKQYKSKTSRKVYIVKHYERDDTYHNYDGIFFGTQKGELVVAAPSKKAWESFKKKHFADIGSLPEEPFKLFSRHNMQGIKKRIEEYNFRFGEEYKLEFGAGVGSNFLPQISVSSHGENIATIAFTDIAAKKFKRIAVPEEYSALKPVIKFLKDALKSSTDSSSVYYMMKDLEQGRL